MIYPDQLLNLDAFATSTKQSVSTVPGTWGSCHPCSSTSKITTSMATPRPDFARDGVDPNLVDPNRVFAMKYLLLFNCFSVAFLHQGLLQY